jgi:hypothetical protein
MLRTTTVSHPDRLEVMFHPVTPPMGFPREPTQPDATLIEGAGRRTRGEAVPLALAGLFAFAAMLIRPQGMHPWRTLWAADGSQFLSTALERSGPAHWMLPYAGSRQVLPRMIGDLAASLPLVWASAVFAVVGSAIAAGALVLFANGFRRWLENVWMRVGLVVALVLSQAVANEVAATAANLHWFLTLGLIGLALIRPQRAWTTWAAAALALLFALSDPFSTVVALLAVADAGRRSWLRDEPAARAWPIAAAMTSGALVQVVTAFTSPRGAPASALPGWLEIAEEYLLRVLGDGISPVVLSGLSAGVLLVAAIAVAACLFALGIETAEGRVHRSVLLGSTLLLSSPAVFAVSVVVNRTIADRFTTLPVALVVAGLLVLSAGNLRSAMFACIALVALTALSFPTNPARGAGPDYPAEVRQAARAQCTDPDTGGQRSGATARVGLSPLRPGAPAEDQWFVDLPCDRLPSGL